jgi:hypothetical protein
MVKSPNIYSIYSKFNFNIYFTLHKEFKVQNPLILCSSGQSALVGAKLVKHEMYFWSHKRGR